MFERFITLFILLAVGLIALAGVLFLSLITVADAAVGAPLLAGWLLLWFLAVRAIRKPILFAAPLSGFVGGDGI